MFLLPPAAPDPSFSSLSVFAWTNTPHQLPPGGAKAQKKHALLACEWMFTLIYRGKKNKSAKKKPMKTKHRDVHDAEEQFLCDAQQTRPDGHDQQDQAAEHVEGEVQGS